MASSLFLFLDWSKRTVIGALQRWRISARPGIVMVLAQTGVVLACELVPNLLATWLLSSEGRLKSRATDFLECPLPHSSELGAH